MEHNSTETVASDGRDEPFVVGGQELTEEEFMHEYGDCWENVSQYVQENPPQRSTNTLLFSFLVLLNAYIPESYLLMSECQKILGPPDPIHGGPPFEERMEPFTIFISRKAKAEHVRTIDPRFAQRAVELLARSGISRSATVKTFMIKLCGVQPQPHVVQFIKDLLTKRKLGVNGKEKFSQLIEDIREGENFYSAFSVLKTASEKFTCNPIFPQTVSRLYFTDSFKRSYEKAEKWAKEAITRAPNNSYVADALGQVYKNRLRNEANTQEDILSRAKEAFDAFKDVEQKADKEEGPEMQDTAGTVSISNSFNNRGLFGFIQVAKIAFEKLKFYPSQKTMSFIQNYKMEVEAKFEFFEWYLTYSKPGVTVLEPRYFWRNVVLCYEHYTTKKATESTSFPGLLDCLNHGLFTSKGKRAGFLEEAEKTVPELEKIRDDLKTTYEADVDNVKAAERYILSNVILSNKVHNASQLTLMENLRTIIHRFLGTAVGHRSPEFYLLVLLLFWPEEHLQVKQEEDEDVEQQATEDDGLENKTWEDKDTDKEEETRGETAQQSLELVFHPDLQQHVTFMERAFERAEYAKYLRGRYLLPLFFLGKGSGLSKWIHKSRLDAIVENKVDAELADEQVERDEKKWKRINEMWSSGEVWRVPEIQDILLPVQVEPQEHEEREMFVCAGGKKITATLEAEPEASVPSPVLFYLGFTIKGPVLFKATFPDVSGQ